MRLQDVLEAYDDNDPFDSVSKEIMLVLSTRIQKPQRADIEGSAEYVVLFPATRDWIHMFAYHNSNMIPEHIADNSRHSYGQLEEAWLASNQWQALTLQQLLDYHWEITS